MKPLIELEDVTQRFGNITALDKVWLKIGKGEMFTLIGPNGSGKTTMLRIMAFIDKPTSGEIYFKGLKVDGTDQSQFRTKSTMVFQKPVLFNTTVYNNIAYGLKLGGYSKGEIDKKMRDVLNQVKLDSYEKRQAKKLSGGEQQRVCLARALALSTELLLLDEPTADLDPRSVSIIEETINRINRELNTTIVMTTHNMFQVENSSHRVALLIGGRLTKIGRATELFETPSESLRSFARLENVFSGISTVLSDGTSLIEVGNGAKIEATFKKSGRVMIFVRPEDIVLSRKPLTSSARNVFRGKIAEISDLGSVIRLKVNAGKQLFVQITKRSFTEMQLSVGSDVFLTFKTSSVHLV